VVGLSRLTVAGLLGAMVLSFNLFGLSAAAILPTEPW